MSQTNQTGASASSDRPTLPLKTGSSSSQAAGQAKPVANSPTDIARLSRNTQTSTVPSAPRQSPPSAGGQAASKGIGTTWSGCTRVSALWSINQDRNSWVGIDGVGWKKLSYASESGVVALTMLAAHGRQSGSCYVYREEDDGMIHETYIW